VQASTWDTLVGVAVRSLSSSQTDSIIQLVKAGSSSTSRIRDVSQREFESPQSLFHEVITSPLVRLAPKFKLRPTAQEFIPRNASSHVAHPSLSSKVTISPNDTNSVSTQKVPDDSHAKVFTESIEEDHLKDSYTEEEEIAATIIQAGYRKYRRKHSDVPPIYIHDKFAVDKWFKLFSAIQDATPLSRYYLAILRGPLPHFMICLEAYRMEIARWKANAKRALTGDHRSIEDALARMGEIK
jgi:hypothetical protein